MELERIKKKLQSFEVEFVRCKNAKEYYYNRTEIKEKGAMAKREGADPIRQADNRINHNFHELLVDEKAAYMFTYPVLFDTGNPNTNSRIKDVLGSDFAYKSKNFCIEASNCGRAWVHYWVDEKHKFKYALVPTEEVMPIYENGLEKKLQAVIRKYTCSEYVENDLKDREYTYIEYWTDTVFCKYKFEGASYISECVKDEYFGHKLEAVPFIEFGNNNKQTSDLYKYKDQIDLYNRVMSGFANDLEDIQQIIYILENYGGQDLAEFLSNLKRLKAINVDTDEDGNAGGVKTLQIEIPVEARRIIIEILRKQIYESGQGLQQDVESVGNASGVALKFFYRKLEMKAGLMETELRVGFDALVRAILHFIGIGGEFEIVQTYTRNMISNDLENAQIAKESAGVISQATIQRNHPWVEDPEKELKQFQKEEMERFGQADPYQKAFGQSKDGNLTGGKADGG